MHWPIYGKALQLFYNELFMSLMEWVNGRFNLVSGLALNPGTSPLQCENNTRRQPVRWLIKVLELKV